MPPFGLSMYPIPSTEPFSDPVQFPVRSGFVVAAGDMVPGEVHPAQAAIPSRRMMQRTAFIHILLDSGGV